MGGPCSGVKNNYGGEWTRPFRLPQFPLTMQRATRHSAVHVVATLAILAAAVLQSRNLCAEAASAAPDKSVTFKSNARLVLIDVVVSDEAGQPVHGLRAQDFIISEDGKSQHITGFQEQRSDAKLKPASSALDLPRNVYTNFVSRSDTGALTVLLFDSLNTCLLYTSDAADEEDSVDLGG